MVNLKQITLQEFSIGQQLDSESSSNKMEGDDVTISQPIAKIFKQFEILAEYLKLVKETEVLCVCQGNK